MNYKILSLVLAVLFLTSAFLLVISLVQFSYMREVADYYYKQTDAFCKMSNSYRSILTDNFPELESKIPEEIDCAYYLDIGEDSND